MRKRMNKYVCCKCKRGIQYRHCKNVVFYQSGKSAVMCPECAAFERRVNRDCKFVKEGITA